MPRRSRLSTTLEQSSSLRSPLPAQILSCPRDRLAPTVETGIYYLVAEALTNAIKHAHASAVTIAVTEAAGTVRVEVRDDGLGGAAIDTGTGLRGLADRV